MLSGFFGKSNLGLDYTLLFQNLELGYKKLRLGSYHDGNQIMRDCILKVYEHHRIDLNLWTPTFLSSNFGERIGHRGHLGAVLAAQKLGLMGDVQRILPVHNNAAEEQISNILGENRVLKIVNMGSRTRSFESPNFWHVSERMWLWKSGSEFFPGLDFTNRVFTKWNDKYSTPMCSLSEGYTLNAKSLLLKLGLPENQPFVALHVRNKPWPTDNRGASISNYLPAVQELIKKGFFVVQIGTDNQQPVLQDRNLITIQGVNSHAEFLTPYILSKSKFFINTCSGPTYVAPLYGTPVLQTNCVAIGMTTPVLSKFSIHLPKTFYYRRKKLAFSEVLQSQVGYVEGTATEFYKSGFRSYENSSQEILLSVRYMLQSLESGNEENVNKEKIDLIRSALDSPARGNICPAYLEQNEKWFLN
jgi:putative glycosyltransferase (TIGR04372 family)